MILSVISMVNKSIYIYIYIYMYIYIYRTGVAREEESFGDDFDCHFDGEQDGEDNVANEEGRLRGGGGGVMMYIYPTLYLPPVGRRTIHIYK